MNRLIIAIITLVVITQAQAKERSHATFAEKNEQLISDNLPTLAFTAPTGYHSRIRKLILDEIVNGKHETEATLGRSALYFPIFEHYLRKYDLPKELKYIPYVETRLKVHSVSKVGAAGLWQFMPYTAQQYKLRTNHLVDERYDPIRATEAAAQLLQDLYVEFDDWLLALAAYNCGAGKVQRAIRLSKSRDFWKLQRHLPSQTRHYIPMFIAAVYVGEFYEAHELKPKTYPFNFKNVKFIKLRHSVRLNDLAKVMDLPVTTVRMLNPGYLQGVVPSHQRGNYIILPASTFISVQRYLTKVTGSAAEEVKLIPIGPIAAIPISLPTEKLLLYLPAERDSQQQWAWWEYAERLFDNRNRWSFSIVKEDQLS